jgi:hypothetical protein
MSVALNVCFELHWLHWSYNAPAFHTINNHASAQAVSHLNLTTEAWVQSLVSTCNICGQSGDGIGLLYVLEVTLSVTFQQCSILIHSAISTAK